MSSFASSANLMVSPKRSFSSAMTFPSLRFHFLKRTQNQCQFMSARWESTKQNIHGVSRSNDAGRRRISQGCKKNRDAVAGVRRPAPMVVILTGIHEDRWRVSILRNFRLVQSANVFIGNRILHAPASTKKIMTLPNRSGMKSEKSGKRAAGSVTSAHRDRHTLTPEYKVTAVRIE